MKTKSQPAYNINEDFNYTHLMAVGSIAVLLKHRGCIVKIQGPLSVVGT